MKQHLPDHDVHTYKCLNHLCSLGPHFSDKLKNVNIIPLLQSLHHCVKSHESASTAHTSTVGVLNTEDRGHVGHEMMECAL